MGVLLCPVCHATYICLVRHRYIFACVSLFVCVHTCVRVCVSWLRTNPTVYKKAQSLRGCEEGRLQVQTALLSPQEAGRCESTL